MMVAVAIPPFERFYLAQRDEVLGYLRRLLGQRAEDAWQETFLRALRAYDRLEHGRHLRAWVFTIATNVALDELRGQPEPVASREAAVELERDAFRELEHLTASLPPKERAAGVPPYRPPPPHARLGPPPGPAEEGAGAGASPGPPKLKKKP